MLPHLWMIPLAPLLGFVVVGVLGAWGKLSDRWAHRVAVGASALGLLLAVGVVWDFAGGVGRYAGLGESGRFRVTAGSEEQAARFAVTVAEWMALGDVRLKGWGPGGEAGVARGWTVGWTFSVDALTCVMLLVVAGIGTLIHVYSIGYMAGERGYWRFFAYLNLFLAMMLTLVLAGNFLVLFVGWEGVGLCSYLLIGFYYDRMFDKEARLSCADCGRKAFLVNRIGDFGFLLGMLLLLVTFGTLDFAELGARINGGSSFWYGSGLLTGIGVLLFVGATGKSAQIPLYVWLPDAMAGPTPVSALIHAATMVTAGVYMLARMSALYWHAPGAMLVVAVVGCGTALFAGTMGLGQYDIKKVLAYSTVSQLGYMFLGAGVGAYAASIFHLVTHAFFKACLFLGAGSVIARSGHTNDMRWYGGLRKWMPVTAATFVIATLAIAGFPFLSGFMSKDEILAQSLFSTRGRWGLWAVGTLGAVLTSFYMFRAAYMTFGGSNRAPAEVRAELKESPRVMTWVLVVLAAGAVLVGFLGVPEGVSKLFGAGDVNWFAHKLQPVVMARGIVASPEGRGELAAPGREAAARTEHTRTHAEALTNVTGAPGEVLVQGLKREATYGEEAGLFAVALVVFGAGWIVARWSYGGDGARAGRLAPRFAYVQRLLHRKWFVDELYDRLIIQPFYWLCDALNNFDRWVVDGAVNGTGRVTLLISYFKAAFDRWVVDLLVNGVGWLVRWSGAAMRRLQSGYLQSYAAALVVGAFALLVAYMLFTLR